MRPAMSAVAITVCIRYGTRALKLITRDFPQSAVKTPPW